MLIKNKSFNWVWWYTPVIQELRRLRKEDYEMEASL
jgi:hypothetical protein